MQICNGNKQILSNILVITCNTSSLTDCIYQIATVLLLLFMLNHLHYCVDIFNDVCRQNADT